MPNFQFISYKIELFFRKKQVCTIGSKYFKGSGITCLSENFNKRLKLSVIPFTNDVQIEERWFTGIGCPFISLNEIAYQIYYT